MNSSYVPERGDIVWLAFDPVAGHEQSGRRPALVVSHSSYHRATGLCLVCPVTSKIKGYPFEVLLPEGSPVSGVVLSDMVRSVDFWARKAEFAAKVDVELVDRVVELLGLLTKA